MCGLLGFCDLDNNIFTKDEKVEIIEKMKKTLSRRGPDESGSYISNVIIVVKNLLRSIGVILFAYIINDSI